jgi:ADP-heptose:LPS heptosyltransferase
MVGDWWDRFVGKVKDTVDVVQVGSNQEKVISGVKTNLLGKTSVRQTFSILKSCATFISVDSLSAHAGPAVGKYGIVLYGRSRVKTLAHEKNENIIVRESCPDIECCRPEPQFADLMLNKDNALQNWFCPDRKCMKAITPELVTHKLNKILNLNIQI